MKFVLSLAALTALATFAAQAEGVPSIDTGCFKFGPSNCDIFANPPRIDNGGFHFGPQSASVKFAKPVAAPKN